MTNLQLLLDRYGKLYLGPKELADLMDYSSPRTVVNAISADRFPIPTKRVGRNRVANVRDVAKWMDSA